jgi:SAM-dependent methyltransferase
MQDSNSHDRTMALLAEHLDIFACPACGAQMRLQHASLECATCGRRFAIEDGVLRLFWPDEIDDGNVTGRVKAFYNHSPFPDYDDYDDVAALLRKARNGGFAQMIDDAVLPGARILECGCGTGQLSAFLSLANRTVFAADLSIDALARGRRFQRANELRNISFLEMNLFRPAFRPESFDVVISMGVLHHTAAPALGVRTMARLLRPGGHLVLSLYHRWGRLATRLRRLRYWRRGWLEREVRRSPMTQQRAWLLDQYAHPHESAHTLAEVQKWLSAADLRIVRSVPSFAPWQRVPGGDRLFTSERIASGLRLKLAEVETVWNMRRGAGVFAVVARKERFNDKLRNV